MKRFVIAIAACAVMSQFAGAAGAEALVIQPGSPPPPAVAPASTNFSDIPLPLLDGLQGGNGTYREQYIAQQVLLLRNAGRTHNSLDQQDLDTAQARQESARRRQRVMDIMRYDDNLDTQVTRDEIITSIKNERGSYRSGRPIDAAQEEEFARTADGVMRGYDKDGNGTITWAEMVDAASQPDDRYGDGGQQNRMKRLLALDPNKDGVLTVAELTALAEKAFDAADSDHDGMISAGDARALNDWRNKQPRPFEPRPGCNIPSAAVNDAVWFVGVGAPGALSTVSVAGPDEVTNTVSLDLGAGNASAYIIAASARPVIWRVTGNAKGVSRLLVMGPRDRYGNTIKAGVTGLETGKVVFSPFEGCLPPFGYSLNDAQSSAGLTAALGQLVGRPPNGVGLIPKSNGVHIAENKISFDDPLNVHQPEAPAGYDKQVWADALVLERATALETIDKTKLVSGTKAEDYLVPPGWAGLAKLVAEGKILRVADGSIIRVLTRPDGTTTTVQGTINIVGDPALTVSQVSGTTFKIVKEISAYPAGLSAGRMVRFIIGRGIKPPPSTEQASPCVTYEDPLEAKNAPASPRYGCR